MRTIKRTTSLSPARLIAIAALLGLAACAAAPPQALREVGGRAVVIGPEPGFDPAQAADPWWRTARAANRFATVELSGTTVLRVHAPNSGEPTTAMLGRRLSIPLLAMPYLHWAWYLEPVIYDGGPGDGLERGLVLSVGFYGGAPSSPQLTDRLFGGSGQPPADRRVDFVFGGVGAGRNQNAAQHLNAVSDQGVKIALRPPQFDQGGEWKLEAIDLAKIYEQFWPRDRMDRTQIAFIAVGGLPGKPVVQAVTPPLPLGYVAEVSLTR
jgi:hypothetical protein